MIVIWLVAACVFVGVGISNVGHASSLGRRGVTVRATVTQDHGWGRFAVRVSYPTAVGQQQQGTLDTPQESTSYPVGSAITVVYDSASPSVVTLPGSSSTSGWAEVAVGAAGLLLLAGVAAWGLRRRRQRGSLPDITGAGATPAA
jgi:LPXTG-motif cell wall-anchored protein